MADERARIARELHDVVAHHVSMMVVQAEAGAAVADGEAGPTVTAFDSISATGRDALGELRRLLGVLREGDGPAPTAPQPGLDRMDELVAQVGGAGLPVDLRVEGRARPLPAGLELTAYRIVQEALTNSLRHAGPAEATVVIRYGTAFLEVEVSDNGRGATSRASGSKGAGQGLSGIRERVALAGGTLKAGLVPGGGFGLVARLPVRDR